MIYLECKTGKKFKINLISSSVAEPGDGANFFAGRSREPEPHFLWRLRLHLLGKQKRKALFLRQT